MADHGAAQLVVVTAASAAGWLVMTTWERWTVTPLDGYRNGSPGCRVDRDLRAAGLEDVRVLDRPDWAEAEAALWSAATQLDVGDDPALAELRQQGLEFLALADGLRRVHGTAHR